MKITRTCWGCGKKFYAFKKDYFNTDLCPACGRILNTDKDPLSVFKVYHRNVVSLLNFINNIPFWYGVGFGAVAALCSVLAVFMYKLDECRLTTDAESCVVRIEPK